MCARTPRWFPVILGAAIVVGAAHRPIRAQAPPAGDDELLVGTWRLNVATSRYRIGQPPKSQTRIYQAEGPGVRATITTTFADGRSTTVGYVANYDSLEYTVTGSPDADTIKLKKVAPRTAEAVLSHAGKVMATVRRVISEDGRTMTLTYVGELLGQPVDYTAVYDKQQ
jgi:hypothetical protein